MKKMKLAAMFAALVSALTFSSCLNSGDDSGLNENISIVTIGSSMGTPILYPDESPNQMLVPTVTDLSKFGLKDNDSRAMIRYSILDGQDLNGKQLKVEITAAASLAVDAITNRPDTCVSYTDPLVSFSRYPVGNFVFNSLNTSKDRFLNIGYAYKGNKVKIVLASNRVSNDTVYLDFKMKKQDSYTSDMLNIACYNLDSAHDLFFETQPVNDSVYITVSALTSEFGEMNIKKDSVTTRCKSLF